MSEKIIADSENDLLDILRDRMGRAEICLAVLKHPFAKERVLDLIAQKGPIGVLTILVTMPQVQGTSAQQAAQQRIHIEAMRREKEKEDRERVEKERKQREIEQNTSNDDTMSSSSYETEDDRETGNCDCRWR